MTPRVRPSVRLACAVHRAAMVLAPRVVRHRHRAEMIEDFNSLAATAAVRGSGALAALLLREIWDLVIARRTDRLLHQRPASTTNGQAGTVGVWRGVTDGRLLGQAIRSWLRRPAYAAAVLLTLTAGTGLTAAAFAVVDGVLLRPLPYPNADRLVTVYETSPSNREPTSLVAPIRLEDWYRLNGTFESLSASYAENVTDTSGAEPERLDGRRVTARYFAVYGMRALVGRTFTPDEERQNGPAAVVISEPLWHRRFSGDPGAIGRRLTIGGVGHTIVGVMPRAFTSGAAAADVWLPSPLATSNPNRAARFLGGIGRLKPDVTIAQATGDLARVQRALGEQFPATDRNWSAVLRDLKEVRIGDQRSTLWLAFGAVGVLWLIGVANLAGLTLVQMQRRTREMAIRAAMGASRAHVIGGLAADALIMAVLAAVTGVLFAEMLLPLVRTQFANLPRLAEITIDARAVLFAASTAALGAAICGLWPAFSATRTRLTTALGQSGRGATARHGLQRVIVVAEVALSVVLAGSATLLVRSYYNLSHEDTGFTSDGLVTFHLGARWDEDRNRVGMLQKTLLEELTRQPGIELAGFANFLPATGATLRYQIKVEGLAAPDGDALTVGTRTIGGDYLRALGVPLVTGAWCPALTTDFNAPVSALVNRRFADQFADGANLIGRTVTFAAFAGAKLTIAGVVGNVAEDLPGSGTVPYLYTCSAAGSWPDPQYVVRARGVGAAASIIHDVARRLDPTRAVFGLRPVTDVVDDELDGPRLNAGVASIMAAAALALAAAGLYSLFMLLVSERRREIGVRLALGASPAQVVGLVMGGAGRLLAAGALIGLLLSAGTQRLLRGVLFGVSPMDLWALAASIVILGGVAMLAVALPAMRARRTDPTIAMRAD